MYLSNNEFGPFKQALYQVMLLTKCYWKCISLNREGTDGRILSKQKKNRLWSIGIIGGWKYDINIAFAFVQKQNPAENSCLYLSKLN